MTSLCPILAGYKLVMSAPCVCLPSMHVQKSACCSLVHHGLEACLHSLPFVLWPFMWAAFWFPVPLRGWYLFITRLYTSFGPFLDCPHFLPYYFVIPAVMTQSYWVSLGLPFTLSPNALTWPLVFLLMGSCVPFVFFSWASLARLLPLGFLILFTNSAFPWVIINFIGLPWPNYFILILGVHKLAINPLLSLFALLLGLQWLILTFSTSYTAHGYAISLFPGFFRPIYLLKAYLFISWTCDPLFLPVGPDGFATCLPNLGCPCCWAFLPSTWILKNDHQHYPNISKVCFVKGLANYIK